MPSEEKVAPCFVKQTIYWSSNESSRKHENIAEKYQTMGLSVGENPDKTRLTSPSFLDPLWFASLCWWPFFSLFSGALCISFSRCPSLDIRLFTYAFSCSLLRSSRCIQPVLATFLTFFRVFLGSLDAFYSSLSLVALSLSFQPIFTQTPFLHELELKQFPPDDKALALPVLLLWKLIKNSKIPRITFQLQPHQFDFPLKTRGQIICSRGLIFTTPREPHV